MHGIYCKATISAYPVLLSKYDSEELARVRLTQEYADYESRPNWRVDWHITGVQFSAIDMDSGNPVHRFYFIAPL